MTIREKILEKLNESLVPDNNFTGKDAKKYKAGVSVLIRTLQFEPDEIAILKKVNWPYGVSVTYHPSNDVTFKTAKMKTVAKILEKHIDFGATSAADVLDLPVELRGY